MRSIIGIGLFERLPMLESLLVLLVLVGNPLERCEPGFCDAKSSTSLRPAASDFSVLYLCE
ncbi:hypothetical protein ACJW31_01G288300 [Castanea mollissima]